MIFQVPFFACSLAFAWGHDAHRGGGRVRFPFDGPPPPPPIDVSAINHDPILDNFFLHFIRRWNFKEFNFGEKHYLFVR